jgi:dihydrofolate reductase
VGSVIITAAVSLDGFIAQESDDPGPVFDWYENGDVAFNGGDPERVFHVTPATADYLSRTWSTVGVAIIGRHLFDITNGWNGRPAASDAVFVMTHEPPDDWPFPDAPFAFITEGIESAVERARIFSGDRDVSITAGNLAGQALRAGLVDELRIDLTPVVLGRGVRYFGDYDGDIQLFGNPEVVQGDRVTHLRYRRSR